MATYSLADGKFIRDDSRVGLKAVTHVTIQGGLVKIHIPSKEQAVRHSHLRKEVYEFSRRSRKRQLEFSNSIAWSRVRSAKFIELGYPDELAVHEKWQRTYHRNQFYAYMEKYLRREVGAIWRVEWEPRKSGKYKGFLLPHIHLLVFTDAFLPCGDVNEWWKESIGWAGFVHTDVRRAKGSRMVAIYIAKYMAKLPDSSSLGIGTYLGGVGLHWGKRRPHLIPREEELLFTEVTEGEMFVFRRAAKRVIPYFDLEGKTSFTLFGKVAIEAAKHFLANRVDRGKTC